MHDIGENSELTNYVEKPDELNVIDTNAGQKHFVYDSQVINLMVPEGLRNHFNSFAGQDNLKLCVDNMMEHCFKARIVAMANKVPGTYRYSRYYPIGFMSPEVHITP